MVIVLELHTETQKTENDLRIIEGRSVWNTTILAHVEPDCEDWGRLSSMAGVKDLFWWWERSSFLCILICWVIIPAVNCTTLLADAVTSKQPKVGISSSKLLICVVQGWPHFLSSGFLVRQHKLDKLSLHPAHSWTGLCSGCTGTEWFSAADYNLN